MNEEKLGKDVIDKYLSVKYRYPRNFFWGFTYMFSFQLIMIALLDFQRFAWAWVLFILVSLTLFSMGWCVSEYAISLALRKKLEKVGWVFKERRGLR